MGLGFHQVLNQQCFFDVEDFIYPVSLRENHFCLFKVLQTNFCDYGCLYCVNRRYRNTPRFYFKPYNLAKVFMELYKRGKVKGLFLSSGVYKSPDFMQEKILETLRILRGKFNYHGFIHSKILPGSSSEIILQFLRLADRVSVNIEAPNKSFLEDISFSKKFSDILKKLYILSQWHRKGFFKSGVTTQMIVGLKNQKDRDILKTTQTLIRTLGLKRVYFSGFFPVGSTPLESLPACNARRLRRLYEAEFLIRLYGFDYQEFLYDDAGNLVLDFDPKMGSALKNKDIFPVDVNKAPQEILIRIPGVGLESASKIISYRLKNRFKDIADLKKVGVSVKKAEGFIRF